MSSTMDLIKKLRGQLPPEAAEQLDALEGLAGEDEEGAESPLGDDADADADPFAALDDEGEHESEEGGNPFAAPEDEEEESDEPMPITGSASKKKPSKKPAFFS